MRIFVAGATGAVGRELVPALVAAGHSVTGMTRTAAKADAVKRLGAEPVVADGLDAPAVHAAVISAKPDVVIDEMTDLAAVTDLRHFDRAFTTTNQLRTRGTDFLLVAAAHRRGLREVNADMLIAAHDHETPERLPGGFAEDATQMDGDRDNPPGIGERSGQFSRWRALRRTHFASTEEVVDHVRALRDEWDRR
jgi:hypothetical protein